MTKDSQAKSATGRVAVLGQGEIDPGVHVDGAKSLSLAPTMNRLEMT